MDDFDLIVRNARVATASDVYDADIGISGGRIVTLAEDLKGQAREELDARGRLVTPGGIDGHIHLDQPLPEDVRMADDFRSGTISAACGGTTTIIPFALQCKGMTLREAVADYHGRADGKAMIDYAFHIIVTEPTETVLREELPALVREGYTSFKIYMTYEGLRLNDREILEVLSFARRHRAMTMVHAENADCIEWLVETLERQGLTAPAYHAASRPPLVEREATHRAISLAELVEVPILLVHVSGAESIEQIQWARDRGVKIYAETCPQYLFLCEDDLKKQGFEGAKYICSPPPRDPHHQKAVWNGLATGLFDIVSSDHAPYGFTDPKGKNRGSGNAPFRCIPNGVPGVETRMPLLFSEGVQRGRITLNRFVELVATNTAKLYGLYPRKGTIAIGCDADMVIWDTEREVSLTNAMLHSNCDYTPYEGMQFKGWPAVTLCRGEVVCHDGTVRGRPGQGEFLRCDLPAFGHAGGAAGVGP